MKLRGVTELPTAAKYLPVITEEPVLPDDFRDPVDAADKQCEAIGEDFVRRIEGRAAPDFLHRYTDAPGLFGILTGGRLRLTNIFGLNDSSELRHCIQ